jgi:hypothetical protein
MDRDGAAGEADIPDIVQTGRAEPVRELVGVGEVGQRVREIPVGALGTADGTNR